MQEPQLGKKHKHKKSSFPFLVRDDAGFIRKNAGFESDSSSVEIKSPNRFEKDMPPPVVPTQSTKSKNRSFPSLGTSSISPLSSTLLPAENENTLKSSQKRKRSSNLQALDITIPSLYEDLNSSSVPTEIGNDAHTLLPVSSLVSSEVSETSAIKPKKRRQKGVQSQSTSQLVSRFKYASLDFLNYFNLNCQ